MTPAESGQIKIADETYRRIRAVCTGAPYLDLDEHAAKITIAVHRARAHAHSTAPDRSHLDGASAAGGEEVTVHES